MWQQIIMIGCGISLLAPAFACQKNQVENNAQDDFAYTELELKLQDEAFALLMETYRQFKNCKIEKIYQSRIEAAAALGNQSKSPVVSGRSEAEQKLQEFINKLANVERNLEMEELQTQLVNCNTTYNCIRQMDEMLLGQTVTNSANRQVAAEQLQSLVIVADGPPGSPASIKMPPLPADAVLLDAEEVAPSASRVIPVDMMIQSWSSHRSR